MNQATTKCVKGEERLLNAVVAQFIGQGSLMNQATTKCVKGEERLLNAVVAQFIGRYKPDESGNYEMRQLNEQPKCKTQK